MKKILIINGHPNKESFCAAIAKSYQVGVTKTGVSCDLINVVDLKFNPDLIAGYRKITQLESDLIVVQQKIKDSNHLVFVYPNWWSTYPALLKGFIDRVFLPKFAFNYHQNDPFWDKLLKGKTAQLIITMDTPKWYYWLINRRPGRNAMKIGVLEFCGIHPVKVKYFGAMKSSTVQQREDWLKEVQDMGEQQAKE